MKKVLASALLVVMILAACESGPEVQVRQVTRIVELPVTVISEVEVTRFSSVTRLIDVTIEITRETEVEVTRIVDKVITLTPTPSVTPTGTPTPAVQSAPVAGGQESTPGPPASLGSRLLAAMIDGRNNIQTYGFHIDNGVNNGYLVCPPLIDFHNRVAAAPTFDIAGSSPTVQNAYHNYQNAISIFFDGVNPMTQNCRNFVQTPVPRRLRNRTIGVCIGPNQALGCRGFIPNSQWTVARGRVIEADDILFTAINNLDVEFDVPG